MWYGYWSYDLNDTCLTKIESQNPILCVVIEFKVFSVKSPHVDINWKFMLQQPHIYTFLDENSVKLELSPPVHNINI